MSFKFPSWVRHWHTVVFVKAEELAAIGPVNAIDAATENAVRHAVNGLMRECVTTTPMEVLGDVRHEVRIDVFVLSQADIRRLILEAMEQGRRDAMQWTRP